MDNDGRICAVDDGYSHENILFGHLAPAHALNQRIELKQNRMLITCCLRIKFDIFV